MARKISNKLYASGYQLHGRHVVVVAVGLVYYLHLKQQQQSYALKLDKVQTYLNLNSVVESQSTNHVGVKHVFLQLMTRPLFSKYSKTKPVFLITINCGETFFSKGAIFLEYTLNFIYTTDSHDLLTPRTKGDL